MITRTDSQLIARVDSLCRDLCTDDLEWRRRLAIEITLHVSQRELDRRARDRLHDVHHGHFRSLLRVDLAFAAKHGDEMDRLGAPDDHSVHLVDDTREDDTQFVVCTRDSMDSDDWLWIPLAAGPVREVA